MTILESCLAQEVNDARCELKLLEVVVFGGEVWCLGSPLGLLPSRNFLVQDDANRNLSLVSIMSIRVTQSQASPFPLAME